MSPKSNQLFPPSNNVSMKVCSKPPTGLENRVWKRNYADSDIDGNANGIHTKTNMPPTFSWWGHYYPACKDEIVIFSTSKLIKLLCLFKMTILASSWDFYTYHMTPLLRVQTPCNTIDKPIVVYRFSGNLMTHITTLLT